MSKTERSGAVSSSVRTGRTPASSYYMNALLSLLPCPILILASAASVRRMPILLRTGAALMWVQLGIALLVCGPYLRPHHPPAPVMYGFRLDGTAALFV